MSQHIHHEHVYPASAQLIYDTLTQSDRFTAMSDGACAEIEAHPGGAFRCFDGKIVGRTLECEPGKRLIQAWRAENWEPGLYSIVSFELREDPKGTRLVFDQRAFPEGEEDHLHHGWHSHYWEPLARVLRS